LKQCKGVCAGEEAVLLYNERVLEAIESIGALRGHLIVLLEGRKENEYGYVLIESGLYKGYGFAIGEPNIETMASGLVHQEDNSDIQRILRSFFRHTESPEILELDEPMNFSGQRLLSLF
jgi:DNA polymerase III subunit epsilon